MEYIQNFLKLLKEDAELEFYTKKVGLDDWLFEYNEFVMDKMYHHPSVIEIDAISLRATQDKGGVYGAEIDTAFEGVHLKNRRTLIDMGELAVYSNGLGGLDVVINSSNLEHSDKLDETLDELKRGESMMLEFGILKAEGPISMISYAAETLSSLFALSLAIERGYADLEEMEHFYRRTKSLELNEDDLSELIIDASGFAHRNSVFLENRAYTMGYLAAGAILELAKEIPVIRSLESLKAVLDTAEEILERIEGEE